MAKLFDVVKSKRGRGFMTVLGWAVSLGATLWTSHHESLAFGVAVLAFLWPVILFWPELKMLRIAYPKNASKLESPAWLYIFGLVSLVIVAVAGYRVYVSYANAPRNLTADEFAQPYIQGKYFKISDLVDPQNEIDGRTFEDDYIYGPAVIYMVNLNDFHDNVFTGFTDSIFIPVTGGRGGQYSGIIALKDCKFRRNHFVGVSFVGSQSEVDEWKHENNVTTK